MSGWNTGSVARGKYSVKPKWWIHSILCLSKQEWAVDANDVTVLDHHLHQIYFPMEDAGSGGHVVEGQSIWGCHILPTRLCCELKTDPNIKSF